MADLYKNRGWLHKRYVVQGKSITEIAKEAKCSFKTVDIWLEKYGLKRSTRKFGRR